MREAAFGIQVRPERRGEFIRVELVVMDSCVQDNTGEPLLSFAVRACRTECVVLLIEAKANVNKKKPNGQHCNLVVGLRSQLRVHRSHSTARGVVRTQNRKYSVAAQGRHQNSTVEHS